MADVIMTRQAARAAGHPRYFNGKPCKVGHLAERQSVNGSCCECGRIRAAERARRQSAADPIGVRERRRGYKKPDSLKLKIRCQRWRIQNQARLRELNKRYYQENSERIRARTRAYHNGNLAAASIRSKNWRAHNILRVKQNALLSKAKRKARERSVAFEAITLTDIIERDGPECYICGAVTDTKAPARSTLKAELEHVVPISKGGGHTGDNLRCACYRCNRSKGSSRTPEQVREFLATRPSHALVLVGA